MSQILNLRGGAALSSFRIEKIRSEARKAGVEIASLGTCYWHFAEIDEPLTTSEQAILGAALDDADALPEDASAGAFFLVTPRFGTVSPWSSKATDIAHSCGLASVERIERGVAYNVSRRAGGSLTGAEHSALSPLIHDRMTETVLPPEVLDRLDPDPGCRSSCLS